MALPSNITYATVKGCFILAVADTADEDADPDAVPAQGQVHFVPNVTSALNVTADPPVVVIPKRVTVDLDSEGFLSLNGSRDIRLVATDNVTLNPTDWTYTVQFSLIGVELPSVSVYMPTGTITDITQLVPVTMTDGVPTLIGPQGPPGEGGSGGEGGGLVDTVNGIAPVLGNVTLTAANVGAAALSHTHGASEIASGTLADARIPQLAQSKINNLGTDLAGKANATHTHAATDIASGTVSIARLPVAASGVTSSTMLVRADDSRLTGTGGGGGAVDSKHGKTHIGM